LVAWYVGEIKRQSTYELLSAHTDLFDIKNFMALEEEAEDLASQMFSSGLLVVHNAARGGEHNVAKLTGGQQIIGPLLDVVDGHIETGRDDAALVEATGQVDHDLAGAMIVDDLELADVAVLHHHGEELDDHLGAGTQQHLALATLLRVVDALQGIGQYVHTHHGCKWVGNTISRLPKVQNSQKKKRGKIKL